MDDDVLDRLKSLHTSEIDALNGYREALAQAGSKAMTPLFREMMDLHRENADELAHELTEAHQSPDDSGSFMTVVHKTIMDVRSLFDGLDDSVLPGLIDGEKRNVAKYDAALGKSHLPADIARRVTAQRDRIVRKIGEMERQSG